MIDVVIVSNAYDSTRKFLTEQAIDSARRDPAVKYCFVVEQQDVGYTFATMTIHYDFEFNYHKCLNTGIRHTQSEYIALCNNDLKFGKDWATNILAGMGDCLSASPWCNNVHPPIWGKIDYDPVGYSVRSIVAGWCIVVHRSVLKKIGKLHEGVSFWYSDNLYAAQIEKAGIRHKLVRSSRVDHMETQTLQGSPRLEEYTGGQKEKYKQALKEI